MTILPGIQVAEPFGIATHDGKIFVSDGQAGKIIVIDENTGAVVSSINGFDTPSGIAMGSDGVPLVADAGSHTVRKLGNGVSSVAGVEGQAGSGDGDAGRLRGPIGIAVSKEGKVYVSDTYNDRIATVANGRMRTLAGRERGFIDGLAESARFDTPLGIAMWGDRLLVADSENRRIRVVEQDGRVWTLAGNGEAGLKDGFPLQASFVLPTAVAVSPEGVIYIADGNAIRAIGRRSFAFVETIAGERRGFRDGTPLGAQFNRPSGLAIDSHGRLLVADSDNGLIRVFETEANEAKTVGVAPRVYTAEEFRALQPPRWPYDPPEAKRDIAGTLGEIRENYMDENSHVRFHNGLDIAGGYGETARFMRTEKVLDPLSADNFGTLRELIRLPTMGYIHIRLGRDASDRPFGDPRFIFSNDSFGKLNGIRIPRGAKFTAGEPIGTLNAMNHVHLIAGPTGQEMNALAALMLPNVSDWIVPTIEKVAVFDENWREYETRNGNTRIRLAGNVRIVVRAFDRMDGNPERRRLGVYRLGYQVLNGDDSPASEMNWSITFDRNPPPEAVKTVYALGSVSGPTGETVFNYIVTNRLDARGYGEDFLNTAQLAPGKYTVRVFAADFFGNQTHKDVQIEVIR